MFDEITDLLDYDFEITDVLEDIVDTDYSNEFYQNDSNPFLIENFDFEIGDADGSGFISQTTDFTCAIVSQQMVLNDFGILNPVTGEPFSEAQLTYDATINGWLDGGTSPEDLGNLLEHYGVDNHHGRGLENMTYELAQGHKVIVGVDADELWHSDNILANELKDAFFGETANHALVVKGIKFSDTGEPIVVVNDPGMQDGSGKEYPLEVFQEAFQDSGCYYVATDSPPPDLSSNTVFGPNFDSSAGMYLGSDQWTVDFVKENTFVTASTSDKNLFQLKGIESLSSIERRNIMVNL